MGIILRHYRLELAGLMFGVDGKLALAEHYASPANPAEFNWSSALQHIICRLQLSAYALSHLAVAIASEQRRRPGHLVARSGRFRGSGRMGPWSPARVFPG